MLLWHDYNAAFLLKYNCMKNIKRVFFMVAIALTCFASGGSAQIYVHARPVRPPAVSVRIAAPSPRHVWIDEDWRVNNGNYEWYGGRWEEPPHPGWRYTPGYWDHNGHGHRWHAGHWHR